MNCISPISSLCSPWKTSSRGSAPRLLAPPQLFHPGGYEAPPAVLIQMHRWQRCIRQKLRLSEITLETLQEVVGSQIPVLVGGFSQLAFLPVKPKRKAIFAP